MFTYVVDEAIHRFERNGIKYAIAYDDCAENPLETMEVNWLSIVRATHFSIPFDPKGMFAYLAGCREDIDRLIIEMEDTVAELGEAWWNNLDEDTADLLVSQMEDIDAQVAELKGIATGEYGEFNYAYEKDAPEAEYVEAYVKDYARWADGEVYSIGVTFPDGSEDIISGFFLEDPYDEQEVMLEAGCMIG